MPDAHSAAQPFAASPVPLLVVDREYRIRDMNAAAETFYGVRADEWRGRTSRELYGTTMLDGTLPGQVMEALDTAGAWEGRVVQALAAGGTRRVHATIVGTRGADGRHELAYCFLQPLPAEPDQDTGAEFAPAEGRFARLFEDLPEALLLLDERGRVVDVNRAAAELYGYERWGIVGRDGRELVEASDLDWLERLGPSLAERGHFAARSTGVRSDGTRFPQETTVTRVEVGGRSLLFALVRDLRDRSRLEAALSSLTELSRLHETGETVQQIAERALDVTRRAFSADRAAVASFGRDETVEWLANHRMDAFIESTRGVRPSEITWLERALRTGRPEVVDRRMGGRATSPLTAIADRLGFGAYAIVPVLSGGELTGTLGLVWTGAAPDIALDHDLLSTVGQLLGLALGNARLRDSLVARQRALDESEERYRSLFQEAPEAMIIETWEGKVVDANRAAAALFRRPREELLECTIEQLALLPADELAAHVETLRRNGEGVFEATGIRSDGSIFPEQLDVAVARIQGEEYLLVQIRDLTEQTRMQGELLLAQKMEALGQLISGVAHELNNPLSAIVAFSQLMQRDDRLPPDVHRDADLLMQEADRTRRIVQNLLDFARQRRPERRPTLLPELIERTRELHAYAIGVNRIEVTVEAPRDLPPVDVDPNQILQVLLNLTINSIQALRATKRPGRIAFRLERVERTADAMTPTSEPPGDWVRLRITDDGPGVPPSVRPRLFEPFFTTRDVGEGTGLGLSVSYGIVTEHGGRLWHEPPAEGGSSFVMELPAVAAEAPLPARPSGIVFARPRPERAATAETALAGATTGAAAGGEAAVADAHATGAAETGTGRRVRGVVLAIDDEPAIRALLRKALGRAGHEVSVAGSGQEALDLLGRLAFDVMLIDHRMSGMDGIETYERAVDLRPDLRKRTVLMSGDPQNPVLRDAADRHGLRLIGKPFDVEQVNQVIDELLTLE